jgi:FAD:protein FMN transferase
VPPRTHRFATRALGSRLALTVVGTDTDVAAGMWRSVTAEFDAVDASLSGYRNDSELAALNAHARMNVSAPVGRRLYLALSLAHRAWRLTEGRFDPRVMTTLVRLGQPGLALEEAGAATTVGETTDWIARDPCGRSVALSEPIDLHGIGKGLALRWAWSTIMRSLPPEVGGVLEAGGDLVGRSPAIDGGDWLVGIEDPRGGDSPIAVVALGTGAACTSSVRVSTWRDPSGSVVHHLIDPVTRRPGGDGLLSVTVAGPDPAWAEVWTKDLFLRGPAEVGERARALGLAAWWVDDAGDLSMTPLARLVTRWP